jgi:hypothetical protein
MDFFRFQGATASLEEQFLTATRDRGLSSAEGQDLAALLSPALAACHCFFDILTKLWRYEFGVPLDRFSSGQIMYGTHMFHRVDRLVEALSAAKRWLTPAQLHQYLERLSESLKHTDALVEMLPVLRIHRDAIAQFEVRGYGEGNRTIDWLISVTGGPQVLLEVKHRKRDMVEYFGRLSDNPHKSETLTPTHNTDLLFQSVEGKFVQRLAAEPIQGVWIHVSIKQEQSELEASFARLDPQRIHFAVLGGWDEDVYILTRPDLDAQRLLNLFGRTLSDRYIFQRRMHNA